MASAAAQPDIEAGAGAKPQTALCAHSIRNETVVIGPVVPEDAGPMFLWLNDTEAAALDLPFRPMDYMGYHNWLAEVSRNTAMVLFSIRRLCDPAIIGYIALTGIHPVHRSAELGVRIGEEAERGKGHGRAAIALALRYAWNHLNLNRVQLKVLATNYRAIRAYLAAGFVCEGVSRQGAFIDGRWCDVVQMAILRPAPALQEPPPERR
jgi:RimJ/RimL family protein N-acetyltransferase